MTANTASRVWRAGNSPTSSRSRSPTSNACTEQPALLDRNVNTWLQTDGDRRMLRTLDGQVRAVLAGPLPPAGQLRSCGERVLPILQRLEGARFELVELTETKMYLKVVTPRCRVRGRTRRHRGGRYVITNSEVGCGTLSVQPLIFRLVQERSDRVDHALRKTHVGRALTTEAESTQVFRDDTLAADDRAFFLKVRGRGRGAVSEATFRQVAQKLQKTRDIRLTGDPVKSVEVLANRYTLNDTERAGVLRHLIVEGDLSAYGLVNAVTHFSQDVDDYDRATELGGAGRQAHRVGPRRLEGGGPRCMKRTEALPTAALRDALP